MAKERYDHASIEKSAQEKWAELDLYTTDLSDTSKDPYYLLAEFPYPSGDLHIGHWYAFAITDIYARYLRMKGKNVLFPIGFDAFGLPAENAAIKHGLDPREWTYKNMDTMRAQLRSMGASFDWSKEVVTCDPEYYKWTQWLFTQFFEHGLAEHREAAVKWCPKDMTVLANEQVIDGHCERCGTEVVEKNLTQWFLKITKYADRLIKDLEPLPWREDIKDAQRAWIGESEGAKLSFQLQNVGGQDLGASIEVFTTRGDTVYGATYIVLAPEHPLVIELLPAVVNADEANAYRTLTESKTERERSENKEKTGVELKGIKAINPATKELIPVFIADYVLASYGTGAVMAVPAHDERDGEFAARYDLPIVQVVIPQRVDADNPHREGKEVTHRNIIIGIVRDPSTGKYLTLKWKTQPWRTFITGGIEEGEDAIEAARREIAEETGYTDLRLVRALGGPTEAQFFAAHKDVNRITKATTVLFELETKSQQEISEEESARYDAEWMTLADIKRESMNHAELDIILARLESGNDTYTSSGVLINSGPFNGRANEETIGDIVDAIGGTRVTNYRLRDWLVSRQRYWGCPIPVVYDPEGNPHAVPKEHLPWLLPTDIDFKKLNDTGGTSPIASSKELKERVTRIFGEGWTPEYDTLDTFVDSSWYFLRYLDPKDEHEFSDLATMKRWLPVDRYSGGSEHTTMHLLYARFFHKVLYDFALVPTVEPFNERFNRGLIMGPDGQKMSKSKGNVVNPDEFVQKYGADAVRMYLAFIGPYNEPGSYPWNLDGVEAMRRFLERVAGLARSVNDSEPTKEILSKVGQAAGKIGTDSERFKFNTAISALRVLTRELEALEAVPRAAYRDLIIMIAPFAPHLAEALYEEIEGPSSAVSKDDASRSVHAQSWPTTVTSSEEFVTVSVSINGKRKGEIRIAPHATEDEALMMAKELPAIADAFAKGEPSRTVYVQGRVLNVVFAP